jgi:hypothetical protein
VRVVLWIHYRQYLFVHHFQHELDHLQINAVGGADLVAVEVSLLEANETGEPGGAEVVLAIDLRDDERDT